MWVTANGQMELVSSITRPEWAGTSWSPEFVNEIGEQVECVNAKRTEARTGKAWAMFVYPRGLVRSEDWPRPRSGEFRLFSPWEQREIVALTSAPLSEASVRRFLELNPETDDFASDNNGWTAVMDWSAHNQNDELKYEILRRYKPIGRCGNDRTPGDAHEKFISFCHDTKRVKCILADRGLWKGRTTRNLGKRALRTFLQVLMRSRTASVPCCVSRDRQEITSF